MPAPGMTINTWLALHRPETIHTFSSNRESDGGASVVGFQGKAAAVRLLGFPGLLPRGEHDWPRTRGQSWRTLVQRNPGPELRPYSPAPKGQPSGEAPLLSVGFPRVHCLRRPIPSAPAGGTKEEVGPKGP